MGFFSWLGGTDGSEYEQREREYFAEFEATLRRQDPDYDERKRLQLENVELRKRLELFKQREENANLRRQIAELERGVEPPF